MKPRVPIYIFGIPKVHRITLRIWFPWEPPVLTLDFVKTLLASEVMSVLMCNYPFIPESHFHTCPKLRASAANMIRMHSHRMIVLCLSNNIIDGR